MNDHRKLRCKVCEGQGTVECHCETCGGLGWMIGKMADDELKGLIFTLTPTTDHYLVDAICEDVKDRNNPSFIPALLSAKYQFAGKAMALWIDECITALQEGE